MRYGNGRRFAVSAHRFVLDDELDAWLAAAAAETGTARTALVNRALYLLRELMSGVPSAVSTELLDEALERLAVPARGPGQAGEFVSAETLRRPQRRRLPKEPRLLPLLEQPSDARDLNDLARAIPTVRAFLTARPGEWFAKNAVVKACRPHGEYRVRVALEILHLDGRAELALGPHHARLFRHVPDPDGDDG